MAGGRPRTYNDDEITDIIERFEAYIAATDIPIVVEFAYLNDIPRAALYDYNEFSTVREKCIAKKESALERGMYENTINTTGAIFSLKQLGWSDRREIEHSGQVEGRFIVERATDADTD